MVHVQVSFRFPVSFASPTNSKNAAASVTIRIGGASNLQRVRGGEVRIGGRDGQDEAGVAANVGHDHVADLLANVGRLVADWELGQAGQVNQGYVQN